MKLYDKYKSLCKSYGIKPIDRVRDGKTKAMIMFHIQQINSLNRNLIILLQDEDK